MSCGQRGMGKVFSYSPALEAALWGCVQQQLEGTLTEAICGSS